MKLTVHTFLTLDGVMQGPGGPDEDTTGGFTHGGWVVPLVDEGSAASSTGGSREADEILLGRTTYDMMSAFWSQITDPEDEVGRSAERAARSTSPPRRSPTRPGTTRP